MKKKFLVVFILFFVIFGCSKSPYENMINSVVEKGIDRNVAKGLIDVFVGRCDCLENKGAVMGGCGIIGRDEMKITNLLIFSGKGNISYHPYHLFLKGHYVQLYAGIKNHGTCKLEIYTDSTNVGIITFEQDLFGDFKRRSLTKEEDIDSGLIMPFVVKIREIANQYIGKPYKKDTFFKDGKIFDNAYIIR